MDLIDVPGFSVTYDYRCPFARNAHEHIVTALIGGAPWDVEFVPFSLTQTHLEEGATPVWEDPDRAADLIAVEAGIVTTELYPDRFLELHLAMFAARHDQARDLRNEAVVREVLEASGVDSEGVFDAISEGWPRASFRKAHESSVADHHVFGVPTLITTDDAVFVRIMTRPDGDPKSSVTTIERVLGLMREHPELNEVKHTTISK